MDKKTLTNCYFYAILSGQNDTLAVGKIVGTFEGDLEMTQNTELAALRSTITSLEKEVAMHGDQRKRLEEAKLRWANLTAKIFVAVCYRGEVQICGVIPQKTRVALLTLELSGTAQNPVVNVGCCTPTGRVTMLIAPGNYSHLIVEEDYEESYREYFVAVFSDFGSADEWAKKRLASQSKIF